jgi:hypothetical protein
MPVKHRFAVGIFAGAFFGTLVEVRRLMKAHNELADKYNDLLDKHNEAVRQWAAHYEGLLYMLNVLEERDVDLTEFDLIALRNIVIPGYE